MNREAGPLLKRENPTPEFDFFGLSGHEARRKIRHCGASRIVSDKGILSDMVITRQARRISPNKQ
jgi:hypothetical protein